MWINWLCILWSLILVLFLWHVFEGVQSAESNDLKQQILNSGTVVFLDFLEKVKNATEKLVRDDQFRKSR